MPENKAQEDVDLIKKFDDLQKQVATLEAEKAEKELEEQVAREVAEKAVATAAEEARAQAHRKELFDVLYEQKLREERGRKMVFPISKRDGNLDPSDKAWSEMLRYHCKKPYDKPYLDNLKAKELGEKAVSMDLTEGSAWIPTVMSADIIQALQLTNTVLPYVNTIQYRGPGTTWDYPIYGSDFTPYYVAEATATGTGIGASVYTPAKMTFVFKKLGINTYFDEEFNEDSAVEVIPQFRTGLVDALSLGLDRCLLFGDETVTASTNINLIDGTPTTTGGAASYWLACDGMGHWCVGAAGLATSAGGDALVIGDVTSTIASLGKYAKNPADLVCWTSVESYYKLIGLTEFLTMDKFGPQATVKTGQQGALLGMPVVMTAGLVKTTSAGKIPTAGGTLGTIIIGNAKRTFAALKRDITLESDKNIGEDMRQFVATMRFDIQCPDNTSTGTVSVAHALLYNFLV